MSHTPGKWTVGKGSLGTISIMSEHDGKTWCVASCTTSRASYGDIRSGEPALTFKNVEAEALANAALIAAIALALGEEGEG